MPSAATMREREGQGNEREAQRTGDGKVLHKVDVWAAGNPR